MYIQRLKNVMATRSLSRTQIARFAGLSRAAVGKWFARERQQPWVNVETGTVIALAEKLGFSPEFFLRPCRDLSEWQALFLWDSLYPTMERFTRALVEQELPALARLAEVLGLSQARRIIGKVTISRFERYKKYIKPIRRRQLEILWPLYT